MCLKNSFQNKYRHRQIDNFKPHSFMFSNDWTFQNKHFGKVLFFWLLTYEKENEMEISMTRNFQLYVHSIHNHMTGISMITDKSFINNVILEELYLIYST